MYWLITYSQQSPQGKRLYTNIVISEAPTHWLLEVIKRFPEDGTLLWFALKISKSEFDALDGEI